MKTPFFIKPLPYALFLYSSLSLGAAPITVTFSSGTISFASNGSGTANYVVNVKNIAPSNGLLTFNSTLNNSNGLTTSQVSTGPSLCSGVNTVCGSPTFSLKANQSCCLQYALTSNNAGNYTLQPSVSSTPVNTYQAKAVSSSSITVSGVATTTPLTITPATLALSVDCPSASGSCVYANDALTGNPRQITITNTSLTDTTTPLTVTSASFPTGTSIATDTCTGASLAPHGTCTITIQPGQVASSGAGNAACTTGIQPNPGTVTVNANSAPSAASSNIDVLSYGCIYQEGYVYSVDDTTATTGSIGGKVVSLTDQAPRHPNGIIWSSNGQTGHGSAGLDPQDVSFDILPGIDETSTPSVSSPTFSDFDNFFGNTYTIANPFIASSFNSCDGNSDGQCNTGNILTFYNQFITNNTEGNGGSPKFTPSNGPTTLTYYAAGMCSNYTIDSSGNSPCSTGTCYSNWYLPAICEMGPASNGSGCAAGTQNIISDFPALIGNPDASNPITSCTLGANCLAGLYWSSTEISGFPQSDAWYEDFRIGSSVQSSGDKSSLFGVRCSRAL